eukprot:SAG11_NODE_61_length_19011_cov_49.624048_19_plen_70_part_00
MKLNLEQYGTVPVLEPGASPGGRWIAIPSEVERLHVRRFDMGASGKFAKLQRSNKTLPHSLFANKAHTS